MNGVPLRYGHFEVEMDAQGQPIRLGPGGMGLTYRAIDLHLRKRVALKVIADRLVASPSSRRRFFNEARTVAQLDHPNIARVLYLSPEEAKVCFFAMELVEGETLGQLTARAGRFPPQDALRLLRPVIGALEYLARHQIVHRDIKPENIMRANAGREEYRIKLIDFGLAKAMDDALSLLEQGESGQSFLGSTYFASPEQVRPRGALDARSDFYSLGATLWFLLTGAPPFTGHLFEVHEAHVYREPDWTRIPQLSPALHRLLRTLLAKEPADRPEDARELAMLWDAAASEVTPSDAATMIDQPIAQPAPRPPAVAPLRESPPGSKLAWERAEAVPHGNSAPAGSGFLARNRSLGQWYFIRPLPAWLGPGERTRLSIAAQQTSASAHRSFRNILEAGERCVVSEWKPGVTLAAALMANRDAFPLSVVLRWLPGCVELCEFALARKLDGMTVTLRGCWLEFSALLDAETPLQRVARPPEQWGDYRLTLDPFAAFDSALEAFSRGTDQAPAWPKIVSDDADLIRPLAATLYSLLGGREPPPGAPLAALPALDAVQNAMLVEAIEARAPAMTVRAWAEAFQKGFVAPPVPPPAPRPRLSKRMALAGACAGVLLLAAGIFAATYRPKPQPDPFVDRPPAPAAMPVAITYQEPPVQPPAIVMPEPLVAPVPPPSISEPKVTRPLPKADFVNTLGMRFRRLHVAGTNDASMLVSMWETRNADYAAFATATNRAPLPEDADVSKESDYPVALTSWTDAKEFCAWLTQKERAEGKIDANSVYRLPTDHEWSNAVGIAGRGDEFPTIPIAQKAGLIHDLFPWGVAWPPPPGAGNFADQSMLQTGRGWKTIAHYDDGWIGTAPVGTFPPNQNGLYDLAGNVCEWCYDLDDQRAFAVIRGGSYAEYSQIRLLASVREFGSIGAHFSSVGFRVVLATQKPGSHGPFIPTFHCVARATPGKNASQPAVFER